MNKWCLLVSLLFMTLQVIDSDRSWHLFKDDHQVARHTPYLSNYATLIRKAWNITANNTDRTCYVELEFDRAIDMIYNHQHPKDCLKAKYLISSSSSATGIFGSEFHYDSYGLAIAMALNRVYMPSRDVATSMLWKLPPTICGVSKSISECYFESWSHCTWDHIDKIMGSKNISIISGAGPEISGGDMIDPKEKVVILDLKNISVTHFQDIPIQLRPLIEWNRIHPRLHYYWWRGVSASYLAVPNKVSREAIQRFSIPRAHNISGKCISVWLPFGDDLHNFTEYGSAIEEVWNITFAREKRPRRNILLATMSPGLFNDAIHWADTHKWKILYNPLQHAIFKANGVIVTHLPHLRKHFRKYEDFLKEEEAELYRLHLPIEYMSNIINMADLLKCDAFVCTLSAHICRLLDELRSFVAMKPDALFADISSDTCMHPPCYGDNRIFRTFSF